jgi:alpha-tubulin suppressor-like RCC1 family protein
MNGKPASGRRRSKVKSIEEEKIMTCKHRVLTLILAVSLFAVPNSFGQTSPSPRVLTGVQLFNPNDFSDITAGNNHTCAIKNNGNVYCWGVNVDGEIGIWGGSNCMGASCISRPTLVTTAAQIEAGAEHTCALSSAGIASCWGNSPFGEVGGGATVNGTIIGVYGSVTSPALVGGNHIFSSISAGAHSTCGTASDGVWCWGQIIDNQSGVPNPVHVFTYNGYSKVAVGNLHACGLFTAGQHEADCWGSNSWGQLGQDPAQFPTTEQPGDVFFGLRSSLTALSPSRLSSQTDFTCADQATGIVQCVGDNSHGQLGNGTTNSGPTFQAQNVGNGMQLHGVSAGWDHACALDQNGTAFCWGTGHWGQLGNGGSTQVANAPQQVMMPTGVTFKKIASGYYHTCAIGSDNHIYCWGNNYVGQIGVGYAPTSTNDIAYPAYSWFPTPFRALDPQ